MADLTVAVCTYNRAESLGRCLGTLSSQVCNSGTYEIFVVDNSSTDATRDVVHDWISRDDRISYIYEPVQGVAHARNTALRKTTAPIIAFTDDDETVPENWVSLFISGFSSLPSNVFAIGGEIDPVFECERPEWLTDKLLRPLSARVGWSETPRYLQGKEWIGEGNSAYRTELLRKYGGFTEELGRQGNILLSSENFVNDVARRDGYLIYFDPRIRITHFIPASRLSKDWFRRRFFWMGVTRSMLPRIAESRYGFVHDHLRKLHLPISPSDWINLVSDETDDGEFIQNCQRLQELGHFLGSTNLIAGR
jgi:glucosyl-dolichyl phosphate glucuronosyltransferase